MRFIFRFRRPLLGLLALLAASSGLAADYAPLHDAATGRVISLALRGYQSKGGAVEQAIPTADVAALAREFVAANAEMLGVSAKPEDLIALPVLVDKLGLGHQRFALRHGGLPVYGGEVYAHVDGTAGVYYVTTKPMGDPPATLTPALDAEAARQAARTWATAEAASGTQIEADVPELVILPLRFTGQRSSSESRLAWHMRVADEDPMAFDEQCFVDAGSSEVLFHFSNNEGLNRRVYDCSKYIGENVCVVDSPAFNYYYYHGRSESAPPRGPDPRVEYPLYFGSTDVDTLHSLFNVNHHYWLSRFGRDGANEQGGLGDGISIPLDQTKGYIHLDNAWTVCPYANHNHGRLSFCRGMVTPDLLGHEYTHGVVDFMLLDGDGHPAGTVYAGEAGALEESYADVSSEGVELAATGLHDWHFGVWFDVPPGTYPSCSAGLFRDLADPTSLVDDYGEEAGMVYPDRFYSPGVYCGAEDSGGIHHNSTVPSYAFHLLSEGGAFNGCSISPIGFDAALQVWYRAWTTYFTRTVTFNEAYFALLQAAADLYPQEIVDQVGIALQAVEMDQPGLCSGIPAQIPACAASNGVADGAAEPGSASRIRYCGPNPSLGSATVEYALAQAGDVSVAVYDIAGRLVRTVMSEHQDSGIHQATWTDHSIASGVYFVRVSVDGAAIGAEKLLVVR